MTLDAVLGVKGGAGTGAGGPGNWKILNIILNIKMIFIYRTVELKTEIPQNFKQFSESTKKKKLSKMLLDKFKMLGNWKR